MPLYEYTLLPTRRQVTLRRTIANMDKPVTAEELRDNGYRVRGKLRIFPVQRRRTPSRVGVCVVGTKPPSFSDKLAAGYKQMEAAGQLRDDPRYLSKKQIKKALAMPDTD